MKGTKKKPNKIVVASAAIAMLTLIIGTVLIYVPFVNQNKSLRSEILYERDRNLLIGKIRALGKHLKVYRKRIPQGRDVSWLLMTVSDMASEEEIEISSIKPGTPEDRGLYERLYIVMDTISAYHQLGKFISKIESSEKFLRIENVDINRLDLAKESGEGTARHKSFDVKANIIISTVILKE